jgi:PAS domain S-box-containing protein
MSLTELPNQKLASLDFLSGGGEMGERIRNFDWSKTPLGPPEFWEQSLKTCVRIMLTSSQPIWIGWGKDLIKLYNDAYKEIVGGKHPEALGQPAKVVWKEIWQDIGPLLEKVMVRNEGTYSESQLLIMHRHGYEEEVYYTFSYSPVPGDDGGTGGMICYNTSDTARVINERSLATLQLLESIAKRQSVNEIYEAAAKAIEFNNKDFPFAIIYKIDEINKSASPVAFAGIANDQKIFPIYIDLKSPGEGSKNLIKSYKTKEVVVSENAGRRKNIPAGFWQKEATHFVHIPIIIPGSENPVAIVSAALNPYRKFDNAYKQFAQLIADRIGIEINNVLNYEQEKKKAAELAELDKAKTVFFSNISHEFRTPLTLMLGNLEEALNEPRSHPKNHERMEATQRNAMRLLKLVNTLLDFSRIESGRQKATYSLTDIASFTKNLAGNFRSVIEKAGLKFIVNADTVIQPVYIDKQMWEKIVFNLLSNAFKYTLDGSITLRLFADNKNVILEIEDTGAGIPENELPHMFERFHRVENVTGRTYEGTGIGLSLTKELVLLHGGTISVKSKPGQGSNFIVRIPFGKEHLPAEQTFDLAEGLEDIISDVYLEEASSLLENENKRSVSGRVNGHLSTVLVVDDNADMRLHIQSILEKDYRVVTAVNGLEALHKIKEENPSIVVSDIMMPIMDGTQLLKEVKQNKDTENLPVILLTARAGEESRIEGYKIGADDYLVKPFSSRELLARIDGQLKITKKRHAAEHQLHSLFEQAPSAIVIFKGPDAIFELANKRTLEIIGKTKEEVIGRKLEEALPELKGQGYIEMIKQVYNTGLKFISDESPVTFLSNGTTINTYVKYVFQPLKNEDGNTTGVMVVGDDVSAQVLARKAVEESENRFKNVLLQSPSIFLILEGPDMRIRFVNKPLLESWGKSWDIVGRNFLDVLPELKDQPFPKLLKQVYETGKHHIGKEEKATILKDGKFVEVYYNYAYQPIFEPDGRVSGITVMATDITEQVKAYEKVQKSEEQNRLFIEHAPAAMAMFDKEMRYLSVSKQWLKEYDLTDDIVGKNHYELFPNILERWKEVHSRCLNGAVESSDEDFYVKDDGTPMWLRWNVHPWYNANSEIGGIVIFTENITERKKQRMAISASEERFRTMANEAPLFVWETDKNLQTTYLNKAGFDYFNLEESMNVSELSWKQYIHPDDLERVLNIMNEAATSHESYTLEMRLKNGTTGKYHWFLDKGAPRYNNDEFIGFIGTSLDIHQRKEIEKELEEKVRERTCELAGQNILLQKQNDLVKKIFDASVDAIVVYDTEMRMITMNQSSLNIFGKKAEDVIGKTILEIVPGMKGSKGHMDLERAIAGETIHNKVYRSGVSNRYYENFLLPLKDEKDKVYAVLVIAHDNTDLIESSKKLSDAQEIAQMGYWEWDIVMGQLTWSENMYSIYGIDSKDGISFEKFASLVHPDDRANMQANVEFALQSRVFNDFFHKIITPTGEEKIMHARGEVMVDKDGKILKMVGTGQDVTKQKMTERELISTSKKIEERNQFIEQLINSALDVILVVDRDKRLITANKKALIHFKEFYEDDVIGKTILELNPGFKGSPFYNDLLLSLESGEVIVRDKVKSVVSDSYYEHNFIPLTNEPGEVYAVMVISHDITESIRQMEELRKLYESDEQKNNFIAMASHELKTPITSIKGYVQLLLNALEKEKDNEKPLPPLLVRSSLLSVDKQIKRLTRLISELLDISKIETGTLELKKEKFSLNQLAIETVEDILYTNTKHKIDLYHDCHGQVYGDKDRIGQVMINLLTNAIKYSPESDNIEVTIHKRPNAIGFSVKDYGIGIDKGEQKRIFERFYRAKGKAEQTYPGFGIGLFIANEFIQKHGGQVWVESEKGKGSIFTFTLPMLHE